MAAITAVSVIGAFPTAYSPGSTCTAVSSVAIVGIDFASSCLPRKFDPNPTAYYSPGTGCPTGYTAQSRCTRSSGARTTITCCPVRQNIDVTMHCVSDPENLSSVWKEMFCTWSAGSSPTVILVTTISDGTTQVPAITMSGGDGINAYGLRMIYEKSDLSTSAATKAATTAPTTSATAESATATSADDDSSSGGMSTGAKAAIGVIIPIVVIAALLGVFFWYRRRKQRQGAVLATTDDEPKELPLNPVLELYGSQQAPPSELAAPGFVSELPGDMPDTSAKSVSSPTSGHASTAVEPSPALSSEAPVSRPYTTSPAISHAVSSNSPGGGFSTPRS